MNPLLDVMLAELKGLTAELALQVVKDGFDLLTKARAGGALSRIERLAWHERVHEAYAVQDEVKK